jgi:hypothetical protein
MASGGGYNNLSQSVWEGSIGATDGTRANSITWDYKTGTIPTQARMFCDPGGTSASNSVLRLRNPPISVTVPGSDLMELDHTSLNSDGFTVALTTNATATALMFPYVVFGGVAASYKNLTGAGAGVAGGRATFHTFDDDFNRADSGTIGGNWVEVSGNWSITGNAVQSLV